MRVHLLGEFRVDVGGHAVDASRWRLSKARTVVKLLALDPGQRLHREYLLGLLWPDLAPPAAANNLHQALHAARRALAGRAPTACWSCGTRSSCCGPAGRSTSTRPGSGPRRGRRWTAATSRS